MGRQKEELSIFEQMGGTYTEKDGILYPNIRIGEEFSPPLSGLHAHKITAKQHINIAIQTIKNLLFLILPSFIYQTIKSNNINV